MSIFKPLAALEIIKGGINQLVASSHVVGTYIDAYRKVFGAFADLIMAALSPFLNVGMLFMTHILQALVSSGLFQKLLMWSQKLSADMTKWINEHAPQIEAFIKNAVDIAGNILGKVGDVGGYIVDKFMDLHDWFDTHLGGFGDWMGKIMIALAGIALAIGGGKLLSALPFMGAAGIPWAMAGGGVGMAGPAAKAAGFMLSPASAGRFLGWPGLGLAAGAAGANVVGQAGGPGWMAGGVGMGMTGMGIGAAVGSVVPGIGTLAGAGIGGLAGFGIGAFGHIGGLGKLPGIGGLFGGGEGGGPKGDVKVENSGNTISNTFNIDGAANAREVADEVIKRQDSMYGALSNSR
jgi:hypothetical protein